VWHWLCAWQVTLFKMLYQQAVSWYLNTCFSRSDNHRDGITSCSSDSPKVNPLTIAQTVTAIELSGCSVVIARQALHFDSIAAVAKEARSNIHMALGRRVITGDVACNARILALAHPIALALHATNDENY
jgi:hypothetical protein